MAKYLVVKTTYFVDPHGTPDEGQTEKFITEDPRYLKYVHEDDDMYYDGDGEFTHEGDLRGSEDGYNRKTHQYSVRELNETEAKAAQLFINMYKEL